MGKIKDNGAEVYRDSVVTGVPASGPNDPAKPDIRALFATIDSTISGALAGIVYYATGAERTADTSKPVGTIGKASDEADYYRYTATGWVIDNSVYEGVADIAYEQVAAVDTRVSRDGIVLASATTIGGNVNEWQLSIPAGASIPNFGAVRFFAPAKPTDDIFVTTSQFGRQPLSITRGFPYPFALVGTSSFLVLTQYSPGNQWLVTANSDASEYEYRHPGIVDQDPDTPSTASHWYFKSRIGFDRQAGSNFQFFVPVANSGPVDITIDGQFTARLRKAAANDLSPGDAQPNEFFSVVWPGADQNSYFVAGTGIPQDAPAPAMGDGVLLPVDSPLYAQSDYPASSTITKSASLLKIVRPIATTDPLNHRLASPNARDRVRLKASWVEWTMMHGDGQNTPLPAPPLVLVDGVAAAVMVSSAGSAGAVTVRTIRVEPGASTFHNVEMVWPYEGPASIVGRKVSSDAQFDSTGAPARPANLLVTAGDSLTQGFSVDSVADQWSYLLAKDIGFRHVNHGYGGRTLTAADGAVYGAEAGGITSYFILANDVTAHTLLTDVTSRLNAFWAGFFGAHPQGNSAKLLMISQTWMEAGDGGVPTSPTGPQYRTTMQSAVAAAVGTYPNLRYKSGLDLTDGPGTTVDGTHMSSATSRNQFYPRLKAHLQSLGWVS